MPQLRAAPQYITVLCLQYLLPKYLYYNMRPKVLRDQSSISYDTTQCGATSLPTALPPEFYTNQSGPTSWI